MATLLAGLAAVVLVGATAAGIAHSVSDNSQHTAKAPTSTVVPYGGR